MIPRRDQMIPWQMWAFLAGAENIREAKMTDKNDMIQQIKVALGSNGNFPLETKGP